MNFSNPGTAISHFLTWLDSQGNDKIWVLVSSARIAVNGTRMDKLCCTAWPVSKDMPGC